MNKPARWTALITWFPLLIWGVYLEHNRNYAWDMVISIIAIETSAVMLLFYFVVAELIWKAYLGQVNTTTILQPEQSKQTHPVNLNETEFAYSQTTTALRFDVEKHMAQVTLYDLENGRKPDFREINWVKKNRHSRFPTRAALVAVLKKWERYHAIKRESDVKNSTYIQDDVRVIRLIASGEKFD